MAEVPASPIPPGGSELWIMQPSMAGIHAQHLVAIEVGLLDTAVLQRDLTIECRRDVEDDGALDLRVDVSGLTTVPQSTAQTTRRTRTAPSRDMSLLKTRFGRIDGGARQESDARQSLRTARSSVCTVRASRMFLMARRRGLGVFQRLWLSTGPTQSLPATQAQPTLTPEQINPGLVPGLNASPQNVGLPTSPAASNKVRGKITSD